MKKPIRLANAFLTALSILSIALIFAATARADVKPGDMITAKNAEQVRTLVSAGT
jgi:hypothetical protein